MFKVYGKVVGKARPRITRKGVYTPKKTTDAENAVRSAWIDAGFKSFGDAPIQIEVHTFRCIPKSRPKKVEIEHDTYKPDWDNVGKLVSDALNGLAYDDDSQIVSAHVVKHPRERREEYMVVKITDCVRYDMP